MNKKCFFILLLFALSTFTIGVGGTYSFMKNEQIMMKQVNTKNCTAAALGRTGETITTWKDKTANAWNASIKYSGEKWNSFTDWISGDKNKTK